MCSLKCLPAMLRILFFWRIFIALSLLCLTPPQQGRPCCCIYMPSFFKFYKAQKPVNSLPKRKAASIFLCLVLSLTEWPNKKIFAFFMSFDTFEKNRSWKKTRLSSSVGFNGIHCIHQSIVKWLNFIIHIINDPTWKTGCNTEEHGTFNAFLFFFDLVFFYFSFHSLK